MPDDPPQPCSTKETQNCDSPETLVITTSKTGTSANITTPAIQSPIVSASEVFPRGFKGWQQIELPDFIPEEPALWFTLCEHTFARFNINVDSDKVDEINKKFERKQLREISDILRSTDTNKYERIKDRIISFYSVSAEKQLDQLLSEKGINMNQKPSQMLIEMRHKGGSAVTDDVLKRLWLKLLPERMTEILIFNDELKLDKLAKLADKLYDERPQQSQSICAIATTQDRASQEPSLTSLYELVTKLSQEVAQLTARSRSRDRTPYRYNRYRSPSRRGKSQNRRNEITDGLCFYHRTYGDRAYRCAPGCTKKTHDNATLDTPNTNGSA